MARAEADLEVVATFAAWLRATCRKAGINTPSDLNRLFQEEAAPIKFHRDKATIVRWWNGGFPRDMRSLQLLLRALDKQTPEADVYGSFDQLIRGKTRFRLGPKRSRAHLRSV